MNKFLQSIGSTVTAFARDEDGSQVVEYALIIALVSIGLALALGNSTTGLGKSFETLIARVTACFTAGGTCG